LKPFSAWQKRQTQTTKISFSGEENEK